MSDRGMCLITGGGRGIGAAVARRAARAGWTVAVNYVGREDAAAAMVAEIEAAGGRAAAYACDVADPEAVAAMFDKAAAELGPLTALVNNAGITGHVSRLDQAEIDTLRRTIDVNVNGALYCAREAVRRMSPRWGGPGGVIVNISSGAAATGAPGDYVWYAASKGAVDSLTRGLSREVAGEDIRVNAVAPGPITTDIHGESSGDATRAESLGRQIPMGRPGTPDEVAAAVLWLMSPEASYVGGTIINVAGGR